MTIVGVFSGVPIKTLAKFADGSPAITSNADTAVVGKGKAVHFAWLPGLSYWFSATTFVGNRPRDESTRKIIAGVSRAAGVTPLAVTTETRVETPLLLGLGKKSAVVSMLNFKPSATVAAPPITSLAGSQRDAQLQADVGDVGDALGTAVHNHTHGRRCRQRRRRNQFAAQVCRFCAVRELVN